MVRACCIIPFIWNVENRHIYKDTKYTRGWLELGRIKGLVVAVKQYGVSLGGVTKMSKTDWRDICIIVVKDREWQQVVCFQWELQSISIISQLLYKVK